MTVFVSNISVAQAATIINAITTIIQLTLSASLVVVLIYLLPRTATALSWSAISRIIHSSVWPTLLRSDSSKGESASVTVSIISHLTLISTVLIAISGVILPLGLHEGPLVPGEPRMLPANYIRDSSPLGLATTFDRQKFQFGRVCGALEFMPCPDNTKNDPNITTYAPSVVEIFNSTTYGPFSMQFRRFYSASSQYGHRSHGTDGTVQSLILRDDFFAVEGLVVDMSIDHPGVGFLNLTVPDVPTGGRWSQDVLWLEPVTSCVDTNLTMDYVQSDGPLISVSNVTDHGGFYRLTHDYPPLDRDGQHIDIHQHAYKGAVLSNLYTMLFLNATRETSYEGKNYTLTDATGGLNEVFLGKIVPLDLSYLNETATSNVGTSCRGFGGGDSANMTNVHVSCGAFLGPPLRTDGGDQETPDAGSQWSQHVHVCSSTTRASIQTITFSTNSSTNLQNLQLSRQPSNKTVLWAVEKSNLSIGDFDPMWGPVDDRYENDPSLWTVRNTSFYPPAGSTSVFSSLASGEPLATHAGVWERSYSVSLGLGGEGYGDYSGKTNYALKAKFVSMVERNPILGYTQIRNSIWTDLMANSVLGTMTEPTLLVAPYQSSLSYDIRFAIPGFILLAIWAPPFLAALILLITRIIKFGYMKQVLNHLSVGRVVVGSSLLRVERQVLASDELHNRYEEPNLDTTANHSSGLVEDPSNNGHQYHSEKSNSANVVKTTPVALLLNRKGTKGGLPHTGSSSQ